MENEQNNDDLTPDAIEALRSGELNNQPEGDDDDVGEYGQKVQKRIHKEISKRKTWETKYQQKETEAERYKRELKEARDKLASYETREDESLTNRTKELTERRDAALAAGELAEYNKLNDELTDVKIELRDRARMRRTQQMQQPEKEDDAVQPNTASNIAAPAQAWIDENTDWIGKNQKKTATAARLERQLFSEGYSAEDPNTYKELDRRLSALEGGSTETEYEYEEEGEEGPPQQRLGATSGVPRDTGIRQNRNRSGKLNSDDLRAMRRSGMNPDNPEHRTAWLHRNKPL